MMADLGPLADTLTTPIVVVGAGGFGRETLDVIEAINAVAETPAWEIVGVVDDKPSEVNLRRLAARGIRYLGDLASVPPQVAVVIGVGSPRVRRQIHQEFSRLGVSFATLIHPTTIIGSQVRIASGSVLCAGVSIGTNVTIGEHVHLNPHAVVGHDTVLSDCVSVNPNATVSGDCEVEHSVLVGAAAVILQGLRVGAGSIVGAGACVVGDVAAGVTVKGVPAR